MERKSPKLALRSDYDEEGYHITHMYVDLYVVKLEFEGIQYILCPLWAVEQEI